MEKDVRLLGERITSDAFVGVGKSGCIYLHTYLHTHIHIYLYINIYITFTCVDLEVHPKVAGIAEGLAAVFTLVGFHSHMSHKVQVELSGSDKGLGAHATLEFLLPHVTLSFDPWVIIRVSVTAVPACAAFVVHLSRGGSVAGPRRRGGAGGSVGEFLILVGVLLLLRLLLLWLLLLLLTVVLLLWAVVVLRLIMVVVAVMAAQV